MARVVEVPNIKIVPDAELAAIVGDDRVTGVKLQNGDALPCRGIFIYVGLEPQTAFLSDLLDRDAAGRIVTDIMMRTSRPGVFAAGDIRAQSSGLLSSIAGDGATAAIAAAQFIRGTSGDSIGH